MKQVFRRVIDGKGKVVIENVPAPTYGPGEILVANRFSLISSGTEISTVKKNPIELGKQVIHDPWMRNAVKKLVTSGGLSTTVNIIRQELTMLRALGYSSAGTVIAKGGEVTGVEVGDKVACAGTNYANHAEVIRVPQNLFVRVPDEVSLRDAAFIRVAAISMHGLRRAQPSFGEKIGIIGLGLLGQLAAQIALAAGLEVYGFDVSQERLDIAGRAGVKHLVNPASGTHVQQVMRQTGDLGLDAVLICASSKDKSIANDAMKMCRKQGRVVAVGIVRMDLERMPFFLNELDFRFSRGHGPGARDEGYEIKGRDYPYGYVRWTEKRNMEEVARLMAEGRIGLDDIIGEIFPVDSAPDAYQKILTGRMKSVASLLEFEQTGDKSGERTLSFSKGRTTDKSRIQLGLIGCGNFTRTTLLPGIRRVPGFAVNTIATATGVNAKSIASTFRAANITTDTGTLLDNPEIDAVIVATRHNRHAQLATAAARAGKHVFMEKPMALSMDEYRAVRSAVEENDVRFMVGYNRRFSPLARKMKSLIPEDTSIMADYLVNTGKIPENHWTLDPVEGGGRLLGEADHFFDMFCFLSGSVPKTVFAQCILDRGMTIKTQYNFCVQVRFENGSVCSLTYTGRGSSLFPKETVHLCAAGQVMVMSDYKTLEVTGTKKKKFKGGDKGHNAELAHFEKVLRGGEPWEIPWAPLCALGALRSLETGNPVDIRALKDDKTQD